MLDRANQAPSQRTYEIQPSHTVRDLPGAAARGFSILGNRAELFVALAKAQAGFTEIVRSRTVTVRSDKGNYTFDYAPLDAVLAATVPALNANGFSLLQPLVKEGSEWVLRTILAHASGGLIETSLVIPDRGTGWQALGGAITYARRYMVGALLGVAPEEDDDGTTAEGMHREVTPKQGPRANSRPTPPEPPKAKPAARPASAPPQSSDAPPASAAPETPAPSGPQNPALSDEQNAVLRDLFKTRLWNGERFANKTKAGEYILLTLGKAQPLSADFDQLRAALESLPVAT